MSTLNPIIVADTADLPSAYGIQLTPLVIWHSFAGDMNAEGGTGIDNGRYNGASGEFEGLAVPTMQDTYKSGTGSRTGRAFNSISGTWIDDVVSPWSDKYYLLQQDSSATYWEVTDTAATNNGLQNAVINLHLGVENSGSTRTAANCYAVLELAYGYLPNYRLTFQWGQPIRLDYTDTQHGGNWINGIAICRDLGNVENYLRTHSNQITLTIRPDKSRGLLMVEVGDGHWLRGPAPRPTLPSDPASTGSLPASECYRFYGARRYAGIEVAPLTFTAPTINKSKRYFGPDQTANAANAVVGVNLLSTSDASQSASITMQDDGAGNLSYALTATNTTNTVPQKIADVMIIIPETWGRSAPGVPLPQSRLSGVKARVLGVWDDATRMGMMSGRLMLNNKNNQYTGRFGNYAIGINGGNGLNYQRIMTGVLGADPDGIQVTRNDPFRFAHVPIRDKFAVMDVPIEQELCLDGFCIFTAVRLLARKGNIHPDFLNYIPNTPLPPYGAGFPFYILPKGTGASPALRFMPNQTALSCLMELISQSGDVDPYTGTSTPHYMFFDPLGNFHFEPWNPALQTPVKYYSTGDTGDGLIMDIRVYNSVAQMRTNVTLQAQDALTYELMQYNLPLPGNYGAVGYRFSALERNQAWGTPAYMQKIAKIAAVQASLPTQVVRIMVPFSPIVFPGNIVWIGEDKALGRAGLFTVMEVDQDWGISAPESNSGFQDCRMWLTCRSIENSIPV